MDTILKDTNTNLQARQFTHPEIVDFYVEIMSSQPPIKAETRNLLERLLSMLDGHGDCPSVVQNPNCDEPENGYPDVARAIMEKTQLWKHTLDVTRALMGKEGGVGFREKAIVCGLAHDLGKIPIFRENTYTELSHPIISVAVLTGWDEYHLIENRYEIFDAIRTHHNIPANELGNYLNKAEKRVRMNEIANGLEGDSL